MIEVELALVAFMLLVIAWQIAGLHELLFRGQLDLLRVLLEDRQDPAAKQSAEFLVQVAKDSVGSLDDIPRWRRRLLMLIRPF